MREWFILDDTIASFDLMLYDNNSGQWTCEDEARPSYCVAHNRRSTIFAS